MSTTHLNTDEVTRVRATLEARAEGLRNKNPEKVRANFAKHSIGYFLEPPLQQSPLQEDLARWFATWSGSIGYDMTRIEVAVSGDLACCHGLSHLSGPRVDDEDTDFWYRETICLRKIEGEWLITHLHESVPMLMDGSFKAAVDLKP